jgi:hypothetical protein
MAGLNIWTTGKKGFQHAPLRLEALATFKIGVTFGNNTFVAVGGLSGKIVRSTDNGSSFVNVTSPTSNQLRDVTFKE